MGDPIRILCVDDHRIVREGIAAVIGRQNDMEVVGAACNGAQAIELFEQSRPDVTLMDLQLPIVTGLEAIRSIRAIDEAARIIVLTTYHGDEDIYRALQAGAATYVLKDAILDDLARVVREVHAGARPISEEVRRILETRPKNAPLTAREIEVLELVAEGLRNKEIADALGITEETVKVHVKNIFGKLSVNDRTAAVTLALRRGHHSRPLSCMSLSRILRMRCPWLAREPLLTSRPLPPPRCARSPAVC
jgi:DNA-binding NarL/FixJ family response regulator